MINLLVDECFAFDYLSILEVKKNMNKDQNNQNWLICFEYLKNQVGEQFLDIIRSTEYNNLYQANLSTFDAVDKARSGGDITAKQVDDCNMERYYAKVALQKRFFPNTQLTEKKISLKKQGE